MWKMQYFIIILVIIASVGSLQVEDDMKTTNQTFCGRRLVNAHSKYCYGIDKGNKKPGANAKLTWPWVSTQHAHTLPDASRSRRASLADECCAKSCFPSEILKYC